MYFIISVLTASVLFVKINSSNAQDVQNFESSLLVLQNDILKVSQFQDFVKNKVKVKNINYFPPTIIKDVLDGIKIKFNQRIDAVKKLQSTIQDTYLSKQKWGSWFNCCQLVENVYDSNFNSKINKQTVCSIAASATSDNSKLPSNQFLHVAKENLQNHPGLKWQYFGSESGVFTQYPASKLCTSSFSKNDDNDGGGYDNRFRPWYVQAITPTPKDIVLVIDRSGSMKKFDRMKSTKNAAITVLNTLNPNDRVAVITFSDEAYPLGTFAAEQAIVSEFSGQLFVNAKSEDACFNTSLASATPSNIAHLSNMVKKIVPHGETYYGKALQIAFNYLQKAFKEDLLKNSFARPLDVAYSRERSILFLSDGEPSDLPYKIFKLIYDKNKQLYNSVTLLCFALGKSTFGSALQKMAFQDFNFQNKTTCKEFCDIPAPTKGMFQHVRETENLRSAMGFYYNFFYSRTKPSVVSSSVIWSVPYYDVGGVGMVITAASAVMINKELVGVVGADLSLHELLADVTYFKAAGDGAYAFIIDFTGRVIIHPFQPSPITVSADPIFTDVSTFEREAQIQQFLKATLNSISNKRGPSGNALQEHDLFENVFNLNRTHSNIHDSVLTYSSVAKYICSAISSTPFMLCVVVERSLQAVSVLDSQQLSPNFTFVYHRLDLLPYYQLCRRQTQAILTQSSVVMLSPTAFVDSGKYSVTEEDSVVVSSYADYFQTGNYADNIKIFKENVRDAVLASWPLEELWKDGIQPRHVEWRYFATEQGVFRIYPGLEMPKLYEPTRRPWYGMAKSLLFEEITHHTLENKNNMINHGVAISPPYLDANGAGLVITISSAITTNEIRTSSVQSRHLLGVMGADIHLSYLEELIKNSFSSCRNDSFHSCIAVDMSGYVIYDDFLMAGDSRATYLASKSNYHLIHLHPSVAHLLITSKVLVHINCIEVASAVYKTNYHLNVDRISQVDISPVYLQFIPNTNVLIIITPRYYQLNADCVGHDLPSSPCQSSLVSPHSDNCETPCTDANGTFLYYSKCRNLYNFSDSGPPPCEPFREDRFRSEESRENPIVDVSLVSWCSDAFLIPDAQLAPPPQGLHSFIIVLVVATLILLAVTVGLRKERIRMYLARC